MRSGSSEQGYRLAPVKRLREGQLTMMPPASVKLEDHLEAEINWLLVRIPLTVPNRKQINKCIRTLVGNNVSINTLSV